MPLRRIVEARRHDLAEPARLHLRHLLRPLVHQQDEQLALRIVRHDPLGDRLQHRRLPGLRRRHDHRALTLAERTEQVDDPVRVVRLAAALQAALQDELLVWVERAQPREVRTPPHLLRRAPVHALHPRQRRALPPPRRRPHFAADLVSRPQAQLLDQLLRHVDVAVAGDVARFPAANEPRSAAQDLQNPQVLSFCHATSSTLG